MSNQLEGSTPLTPVLGDWRQRGTFRPCRFTPPLKACSPPGQDLKGNIMEYLLIAVLAVGIGFVLSVMFRVVTVFDYERGLKFVKGKFRTLLEPGRHWYAPFQTVIQKIDIRPRHMSITGQEVLSSDGVTLKVSLAANYVVTDPHQAVVSAVNYQEALYLELQLALRELIGQADIDSVLAARNDLAKQLEDITKPKAAKLGVELISVNFKDIMFPGKLKEIFAQVVNAKKESLAVLEKTRGETAALRNLANAARMLDENPNLMQLRLLQAIGESSGNTIVLGAPLQSLPLPVTKGKPATEAKDADSV